MNQPRGWSFALPARFALALACVAAPTLAAPSAAPAQEPEEFRASQWAKVAQQVALTRISVEYHRPVALGRSPLFGGVVHWGEVWTPGANDATVLELSADAEVEGHDVPAGRWSVWMIPSGVGPWELILDPRDTLFHTQRPGIGDEGQIRFEIRTEPVDHVEALTWSFPRIEHDNATLVMSWGGTSVPLEIEVEPALPDAVVSAGDAEPYVGEWEITFAGGPPDQPTPPPTTLTVWHAEDGFLMGRLPPMAGGPPAEEPDPVEEELSPRERERAEARRALREQGSEEFTFMLVPFAEGIFRLGFVSPQGQLSDVENFFFEFDVEGTGPPTVQLRNDDDAVVATGERGG